MNKDCEWGHKIFSVSEGGFEALALEIFRFQYAEISVYKAYVDALGITPENIRHLHQIPFLPISFFKTHSIKTQLPGAQTIFQSSGTTGTVNSKHFVQDISIYEESFIKGFELFYGPISDWNIVGLLPSYLERGNSSLVYMVNRMIQLSGRKESGFYLNEYESLYQLLIDSERREQKTLLIGVTFGLLDFAERFSLPLRHTVVMETGGMKGRRKEMIREEVHSILMNAFSVSSIHSEYGMTELLSQAYSTSVGTFECPPWMQVMIREEDDPLQLKSFTNQNEISGALNVIDLANVYSCSFIATEDVGRKFSNGSFEVQGRMDASDMRGCNLLIA